MDNNHDKDWIKPYIRGIMHTRGSLFSARVLAVQVFHGMKDKGGEAYFNHLQRVADGIEDPAIKPIAYLHYLIEDIPGWDYDDLRDIGFSEYVINGIRAVTKQENALYFDEMVRVGMTAQAIPVKRSDLRDNSNLLRLNRVPTEKDMERARKYYLAYHYLGDVESGKIKPGTPFASWMMMQPEEKRDTALLAKYTAPEPPPASPKRRNPAPRP